MTLPPRLRDFLSSATIAQAGTRDRSLVPHVHRVSGWEANENGRITCLFADAFARHLIPSLEDNGEMALTVAESPSHVTYQLKGRAVELGPAIPSDHAIYDACRERAARRISEIYGFDVELVRLNLPAPSLRVVFEVREVFDQTPGPDAGRRLLPEEPA